MSFTGHLLDVDLIEALIINEKLVKIIYLRKYIIGYIG